MSYFVLRYDAVVDDYVNRRAPYRAEHLRLLQEAHSRGDVVMAGAVGESPVGAIIIFRSQTPELAEQFYTLTPVRALGAYEDRIGWRR